jgi:hypothetical protein
MCSLKASAFEAIPFQLLDMLDTMTVPLPATLKAHGFLGHLLPSCLGAGTFGVYNKLGANALNYTRLLDF